MGRAKDIEDIIYPTRAMASGAMRSIVPTWSLLCPVGVVAIPLQLPKLQCYGSQVPAEVKIGSERRNRHGALLTYGRNV